MSMCLASLHPPLSCSGTCRRFLPRQAHGLMTHALLLLVQQPWVSIRLTTPSRHTTLGCFVPTFLFSKTSRIWPLVQPPQGLPLPWASWFLRALPSLWSPPYETTSHSLPSPVISHHKPQLQPYLTSSSRLALRLIVQGFTSSALAFLAHPLIHTWRATCPTMTTAGNVSQSHSPAWKNLDSTPQATAASWIP